MGLVKDRTYIGQVISIQEAADSFKKTTGATSYCHKITIVLDATGETELVQLCLDYPRVEAFEVNDFIKFKAHKQGKGEWTIHFEEKVWKKPPAATTLQHTGEQSTVTKNTVGDVQWVSNGNPVIIGTVIDRAFSHTAHFLQMRGNVTDDDFIALAKRVAEEMRKQIQSPVMPF